MGKRHCFGGIRPTRTRGERGFADHQRAVLDGQIGFVLQAQLGEHGFGNHNSTGVAEGADGDVHGAGLNGDF